MDNCWWSMNLTDGIEYEVLEELHVLDIWGGRWATAGGQCAGKRGPMMGC